MVKTYKDWSEYLPFALWGYRTTMRTATGQTPFLLVYGCEAVLPIEIEIKSLRVMMEAKTLESEWAHYSSISPQSKRELFRPIFVCFHYLQKDSLYILISYFDCSLA